MLVEFTADLIQVVVVIIIPIVDNGFSCVDIISNRFSDAALSWVNRVLLREWLVVIVVAVLLIVLRIDRCWTNSFFLRSDHTTILLLLNIAATWCILIILTILNILIILNIRNGCLLIEVIVIIWLSVLHVVLTQIVVARYDRITSHLMIYLHSGSLKFAVASILLLVKLWQ